MTVVLTGMDREQFQAHLDNRSVNTRDAASVAAFFSEDGVQRVIWRSDPASGRHAIREAMETTFGAFPDFHIEVRDVFTWSDRMCAECTMTGTHDGEGLGFPPTGRRIHLDICLVSRMNADGLVEEEVIYGDSATMLHQLGVLGAP